MDSFASLAEVYRQWVLANPKVVHRVEEAARLLTLFVPARFGDGDLASEAAYAAVNLLGTINSQIVRHNKLSEEQSASDAESPESASSLRPARWTLTALSHVDVVLEIVAERFGTKTSVITFIETVRVLCRLLILAQSRKRMLHNGGRLAHGGEVGASDDPSASGAKQVTWIGQRSGRVIRVPESMQKSGCDYERQASATARALMARLDTRSPSRLASELLFVMRPLVYVLMRRARGDAAWLPWLTALSVDVGSLVLASRARSEEEARLRDALGDAKWRRLQQHRQALDADLTADEHEITRRKLLLLLYLMRNPLFGSVARPVLQATLGNLGRLPLLGIPFRYALEMLLYVQRRHFYIAGSA